ncbi:uncharacterized protein LOC119572447 [Penaeus monodon]|uniref:uncharacterized protein LOC119572447 n=1 Tax=Penaeus monodon TaxID=6687 RepID=UPI0018A76C45|nr:uncharacterized protein LOC119572447 [Penaeus monodon]
MSRAVSMFSCHCGAHLQFSFFYFCVVLYRILTGAPLWVEVYLGATAAKELGPHSSGPEPHYWMQFILVPKRIIWKEVVDMCENVIKLICTIPYAQSPTVAQLLTIQGPIEQYKAALLKQEPVATMTSQRLFSVLTVALLGVVSRAAPPPFNVSLIEPRVNFDDKCKCGQKAASRIVGGVTTGVNEWPWQAALMYESQHFCGGSLINDRYVLTAAHCTEGMRASDLTIRLAEHRLSTSSETSVVSRSVSRSSSIRTISRVTKLTTSLSLNCHRQSR